MNLLSDYIYKLSLKQGRSLEIDIQSEIINNLQKSIMSCLDEDNCEKILTLEVEYSKLMILEQQKLIKFVIAICKDLFCNNNIVLL